MGGDEYIVECGESDVGKISFEKSWDSEWIEKWMINDFCAHKLWGDIEEWRGGSIYDLVWSGHGRLAETKMDDLN